MNEFQITQKHYDILIKQGYDNLPYETGGFLGGKDGLITAILPSFNKHDDGRKDNFVFTTDDVIAAHGFFKKHNVDYYGLYHTHPTGVAYPSQPDINSGQRYHFIISYQNKDEPVFNAFQIINKEPHQLPFTVVSNKGFRSLKDDTEIPDSKFAPQQTVKQDTRDLNERITKIISDEENKYERIEPRQDVDGSEFSTMA
ncbi:hypothetical protein DID76_01325 [Candidatus Marinamargulisbacteria bacterium SCGC AG-414-C22]|nr:hypothetical protein DID76_01325 [Candidatus Marinamargulisbacteria bacterium SCGC AG-414-C22]